MASRYDTVSVELRGIRSRQFAAVLVPSVVTALLISAVAADGFRVISAATALVLLPAVFHLVWRGVVPPYRAWSDRAALLGSEVRELRRRVAVVFGKYRQRRKGEHFKRVYGLAGRPVRDLEEALAVGMFRERREVFVTAFMRKGIAVRVTASIGSPFRCSAADNPALWKDHVDRLGCDEVRQYHNHPAHNGSTAPSTTDARSSGALKRLLGPHSSKLRSLVLCWNELREWRIFEYDETGKYVLHFACDAKDLLHGD